MGCGRLAGDNDSYNYFKRGEKLNDKLLLELKEYIAKYTAPTQYEPMDSGVMNFVKEDSDAKDFMAMEPEKEYSEEKNTKEKYAKISHRESKQPVSLASQNEIDIESYIRKTKSEETFSSKLLKYIELTGLPEAEIYKRAGIDRRHFSKIRCDKDYKPKKTTVLVLCLALKLEAGRTDELLKLAGYSLSSSDTRDLVVKFCIEKEIFDLIDVNAALDYFGVKGLGVVE